MKIEYTNVQPFIEGIKQMARIVVLGIAPIILTGINLNTGDISINWKIVLATSIAIVTTAILSGIDKDRHLTGKIENDAGLTRGLTQF